MQPDLSGGQRPDWSSEPPYPSAAECANSTSNFDLDATLGALEASIGGYVRFGTSTGPPITNDNVDCAFFLCLYAVR